jgi:2-keto-4-pentenoate hydratase/2-oxohepta-3-ene-1,7-dioic acid hydratase in catechol pathway
MTTGFRLATYKSDQGPRAAILVGDKAIDAAAATGNASDTSVTAMLADWPASLKRLDAAVEKGMASAKPLASITLLAPIPLPVAIYCAGANYRDHANEMARAQGKPDPVDPHELGLRSWHFIKIGHCVTGPDTTVKLPVKSKKVDWEVELAVIIGRTCRNATEQNALDYVMGYTVANDLSARDLGNRAGLPENSNFRADWVSHKCFDGSCPMGPSITLARDIGNPHDLKLGLDVNGVKKQNSNTSELIFNINEQIADISGRLTLHPGDIVLTGTPAGVGAGKGEFLKAGDKVRAWVENIGDLNTTMA